MLGAKKIASQGPTPFATSADFCRIFGEGMNSLYLLSFLLTADHSIAEKCFVCGLEDSAKGNTVFKEWAQSWARRTIIRNAIRMIQPRPTGGPLASPASDCGVDRVRTEPAEIASIVEVPAFERFAFVMSVLERYSDQECSLLLSCTRGDVMAARTRAVRQIARLREPQRKLESIDSNEARARNSESVICLEVNSHLPASA
ncbi:MAG TPA: hypothetical protein VFF64_24030 [Candidatus Eremiobacteraceae bacterium]|nr:hypothetical protein [Candidatus Eremiobacteraceae bacterium]